MRERISAEGSCLIRNRLIFRIGSIDMFRIGSIQVWWPAHSIYIFLDGKHLSLVFKLGAFDNLLGSF